MIVVEVVVVVVVVIIGWYNMIFELSGCKFLYANLPETEIWTGASNNRIWHRWHNSVPKSQIIFPYVHIDISLVHRFSHCRRTSQ